MCDILLLVMYGEASYILASRQQQLCYDEDGSYVTLKSSKQKVLHNIMICLKLTSRQGDTCQVIGPLASSHKSKQSKKIPFFERHLFQAFFLPFRELGSLLMALSGFMS